MRTHVSVMQTKLAPPQLRSNLLKRPASIRKLKQLVQYPLTLVHAGAGYGKSTILTNLVQEDKTPFCWYTVSPHDSDLLPFVAHLIHSVRTVIPAFGEHLLEQLTNTPLSHDRRSYVLCTEFINGLASLTHRLILIIDDYHHVEQSEEIHEFLNLLLQHKPDKLHLVVSTRHRPKWDVLPKLKIRDELLEITERDLSLSEEEIDVLFHDYYECPLEPAQVKQILEKTEGWIIAIQLVWQQLAADVPFDKAIGHHIESTSELFPFLAMEVLQTQPEHIRSFLLHTCIFDEFNASLCNEILQTDNSTAMLEKLMDRRLFLIASNKGEYRYHALFRDFLLQQLARDPETARTLRRRAADVFASSGRNMQALIQLKALEDAQSIANLIEGCGEALLAEGRLDHLQELLKDLPESCKDSRPLVWICEGEVLRHRCSYEKSMEAYVRAERIGAEKHRVLVQCRGLEGQARIYLDTIQPGRAESYLQRAIELLEAEERTEEIARGLSQIYRLMAENLLNSGRTSEAPKWVEKSKIESAAESADDIEARLHLRTGRLHAVRSLLMRGLKVPRIGDAVSLSRSHRETDVLLSLVEAFLGNAEQAKYYAESGMMLGVQRRVPYVEACGWMRMGHAAQLMPKYSNQVALNCYMTALEIMEGLDMPRGQAEPLMGLCLLFGRDGAYDLGMQYGRQGLLQTEKANDLWLSSLIRLGMAITAHYTQHSEEANELLELCRFHFAGCGDSYGLTLVYMWQSLSAYHNDDEPAFAEAMSRFLLSVRSGQYEFLFHHKTLFGPKDVQQLAPLLFEAQRLVIEPHYVTFLLTELGLDHMEHHPGYTLRIETLGGFRVRLGEKEVTDKDWQRGKAKELFQLLVTKRRMLLPREEIFTMLWKQSDEKAASRDFKVALNALNVALEPGRRARSMPFFIQRHGASYGLNLASGFELDAVEFETLVKAGLEEKDQGLSKDLLLRGLYFYKGDYMPDRRYDDWCLEERERLQVLFLRGAEKLATLLCSAEEYDTAVHWCERILQTDPCWEEAYRLLMLCHYQRNNRNQAMKWYHKCCEVLERELGVAPLHVTQSLYETIRTAPGAM